MRLESIMHENVSFRLEIGLCFVLLSMSLELKRNLEAIYVFIQYCAGLVENSYQYILKIVTVKIRIGENK